jgi:hypothetical protein
MEGWPLEAGESALDAGAGGGANVENHRAGAADQVAHDLVRPPDRPAGQVLSGTNSR